ncbi:MAG: DUF1573 domain-containing protein [Myxococcales bacterium]|nr:DUF1573 domain-containing protein [Myxococcales bacterium]
MGEAFVSNAAVEPDAINFGTVLPGSVRSDEVSVRNSTDRQITVSSDFLGEGPFAVDPSSTVELEAFEGRTFGISFEASPDSRSSTFLFPLRFTTTGLASDRADVQLRAGIERRPIRCPERVDLGFVPEPEVRVQTFSCTNATDQAVTLLEIAPPPDVRPSWSFEGTDLGSIAPRASFELTVRFDGTGSLPPGRLESTTLTLVASNPEDPAALVEPTEVDFEIRGGAPAVIVSPSALDFGAVRIGSEAVRGIVVRSVGVWPTPELRLELASEFFDVAPTLAPIAPGREVVVDVRYAPDREGVASGHLRVLRSDTSAVVGEVALSGEGLSGDPCNQLEVSLDALPFGIVHVERDRTAPVRVRNRGAFPCRVGPFEFLDDETSAFSMASTSQRLVDPGDVVLLDVKAETSTTGLQAARLRFPVFGLDAPQTVELSLQGVDLRNDQPCSFCYTYHVPDPAAVTFGAVPESCSPAVRRFRLYNGDFGLPVRYLTSVRVSGPDAARFALTGVPEDLEDGRPWELTLRVPLDLDVVLRPGATGALHAWIEITEQESSEPYVIHLTAHVGPAAGGSNASFSAPWTG